MAGGTALTAAIASCTCVLIRGLLLVVLVSLCSVLYVVIKGGLIWLMWLAHWWVWRLYLETVHWLALLSMR